MRKESDLHRTSRDSFPLHLGAWKVTPIPSLNKTWQNHCLSMPLVGGTLCKAKNLWFWSILHKELYKEKTHHDFIEMINFFQTSTVGAFPHQENHPGIHRTYGTQKKSRASWGVKGENHPRHDKTIVYRCHLWGVPFARPKIFDFEAFYKKNFTRKKPIMIL